MTLRLSGDVNDQAHCDHVQNPLTLPCNLVILCNETLIFLGISRRIYVDSIVGDTRAGRFMSFIKGEGLYNVSKSLLRSGQLYYG